jgi:hypothetical protein
MRQVILLMVTVALIGGLASMVARMSLQASRKVWLVAFVLVVGGGVTMMVAHSFVAKWAFKGDSTRDGLESMIEGTASRPFVYRRLAPDLVGAASHVALEQLPPRAIEYLVEKSSLKRYRIEWGGIEEWTPRKAVEFHVAYALVWCALFGLLLAGAALVHVVRRCSALEAIVTSMLGVALMPLLLVGGGYLYDAPELLLWTTLLFVTLRGWFVLTPFVFVLMLANKESALIAVPALFPLFLQRTGMSRALIWTAVLGALGVLWLVYVRSKFAACAGQPMESWFRSNLEFWTNPTSYFKAGQLFSPGLLSPEGANVLVLLFVLLPVRFGWPATSTDIRRATVITAAILLPLFITSSRLDEIRNLSILFFPLLFVIVVEGVHAMFWPRAASDPASTGAAGRSLSAAAREPPALKDSL